MSWLFFCKQGCRGRSPRPSESTRRLILTQSHALDTQSHALDTQSHALDTQSYPANDVGRRAEMPNLSYSFHLSTKSHSVSTTGKVLQVSRHNLRQYKSNHYDQKMINILRGSDTSILDDVKRIYHEEFDDALERYNKGKRSDRVINDYLEHVSESRGDVACEIIIQIGDREFWESIREKGWSTEKIREEMSPIFKSQLEELERLVPELKIASAVEHYDESSPHMHVVGIPVATGYKKGLSKQVAKTKIFTPDRLSFLQDKMRVSANKDVRSCNSMIFETYDDSWYIDLDEKKPGRNRDIPKNSLDEYYRVKKETEKKKEEIKRIDLEKQAVEKEKGILEIDVNSLQKRKEALEENIADIADLKGEKEKLEKGNRTLRTDKLLLEIDIRKLQKERGELEADVSCLKQEKNASQEVIRVANEKNASLVQLRTQIKEAEDDIKELDRKAQEKQGQLTALSKQVEEKLDMIEADLSPEFMHQMLNDSVTSNLVQETIQQTCNQLGELGYLKVGPTTAVLKINKNSILNHIKEHVTDFINDVKRHISRMLINHGRTKRRGR